MNQCFQNCNPSDASSAKLTGIIVFLTKKTFGSLLQEQNAKQSLKRLIAAQQEGKKSKILAVSNINTFFYEI